MKKQTDEGYKMLLSACIINRNNGASLLKTIKSIKNIVDEILVINWGNSCKINHLFQQKKIEIKVVNCGDLSSEFLAKKKALKMSNGAWILFINSDEVVDEHCFNLRYIIKNTDKEGLFLPVVKFDDYKEHDGSEKLNLPCLKLRLFRSKKSNYFLTYHNKGFPPGHKKKTMIKMGTTQLPIIHSPDKKMDNKDNQILHIFLSLFWNDIEIEGFENNSKKLLLDLKQNIKDFRYNTALHKTKIWLDDDNKKNKNILLKNENILLGLGFLAVFTGAKAVNARVLSTLKKQSKQNNSSDMILAWYYYRNKKYKKSLKKLRRVKRDQSLPASILYTAQLIEGMVELKIGRTQQAYKTLKRVYHYSLDKEILKLLVKSSIYLGYGAHKIVSEICFVDRAKCYDLIKVLFELKSLKLGLKVIETLQMKNLIKSKNEIYFWKGKIWLALGDYRLARFYLSKIKANFKDYKKALDLLWIIDLNKNKVSIPRSAANQLKLMGEEMSWSFVNHFHRFYYKNQDIKLDFNSPSYIGKYRELAYYYLDLFLDFASPRLVSVILRIFEKHFKRVLSNKMVTRLLEKGYIEKAAQYSENQLKRVYITDMLYAAFYSNYLLGNNKKAVRYLKYLHIFIGNSPDKRKREILYTALTL